MKDYVNWAILAPGKIANSMAQAMSESSKNNKTIRLYAVASRHENKAENFSKQWGFKKAYNNYEDLYNDPEVDAVYVAPSHVLHYKTVKELLKHNKSVLCENPAACNVEQLLEIIQIANEKKLFFMEAMWTAFNPTLKLVKEYMDSGVIGTILNIESKFCTRTKFGKDSRLWNPNIGGGALQNLGIYNIFFSMFMNNFQGIESFSSNARFKNNVDSWNCININFSNKVITNFQSALDVTAGTNTNNATIFGTKGFITIKDFYRAQEAELHIYKSEEGNENEISKIFGVPFEINGYEYELLDATNQILKGEIDSEIYTQTDSIYLASIMNDIREQWNFRYPFEKDCKPCTDLTN